VKRIQKVYLVGLGAIGCAYGSLMQDKEPGLLKVVADRSRIRKYTEKGIYINNKRYQFDFVEPKAPAEDNEQADLVIISVKYHQLGQAIKDIKGFVGRDTIILSLLNGINSEQIIGEVYGMDKMLLSFSVGIDAVRDDTAVNFTKRGKIIFGEEKNTQYSAKVLAVKELFDRVGIQYMIPGDMVREMWFKFMINVAANQVSAVTGAGYGDFINIREVSELARAASMEVIRLAGKLGISLSEKDIDEMLRIFGTLSPRGKTSMLQDILAGRKTEVEIFSGTVIDLGEKHGVDTPVNRMLFNIIRSIEKINSGKNVGNG